MPLTDDELLAKVKEGLGISSDASLRIKTIAVKQYMLNAGITAEQIETELGIATLTIGVSDIWNLEPGEVTFSSAFSHILMPQLMAVSLPEVST